MFILGHMGITAAAAYTLDYVPFPGKNFLVRRLQQTANGEKSEMQSGKARLIPYIDIRLLLFGSLLPDIIDKPLGHIILRDSLNNGRIYCHTLLFAIIVSLFAFYLWKQKSKFWLLPVALGVIMHFILDEMWLMPHTLLWPLYGWAFPEGEWDSYWSDMLGDLVSHPRIYITEIIGGLILTWAALIIFLKEHVRGFLKSGLLK